MRFTGRRGSEMSDAGWKQQDTKVLSYFKKISMLQESHGFSWLLPFCFRRASQCIGYSFILG